MGEDCDLILYTRSYIHREKKLTLCISPSVPTFGVFSDLL